MRYNLFGKQRAGRLSPGRALDQKIERIIDRIFRLLGLCTTGRTSAAARWTLQHGDQRTRASALEYLDNILSGPLRKQILFVLEEMPLDEKVRRGNVLIKTRSRPSKKRCCSSSTTTIR